MHQLAILARQFRDAIEQPSAKNLLVSFETFPTGACSDAALLLARFLTMQGMGAFRYMSGERGAGSDYQSHAWLQQGAIIIDITADQFAEIDQAVIVTTDSDWHATFTAEEKEADFTRYDSYTAASLGTAYQAILQHLSSP